MKTYNSKASESNSNGPGPEAKNTSEIFERKAEVPVPPQFPVVHPGMTVYVHLSKASREKLANRLNNAPFIAAHVSQAFSNGLINCSPISPTDDRIPNFFSIRHKSDPLSEGQDYWNIPEEDIMR